jgi:hypothetical protein
MSKGKCKSSFKFVFDGHEINYSNSMMYLGFQITSSMSVDAMIEDKIKKVNRASYLLRQALSAKCNVNVDLATSLYDKMILPVLLYGCCIWAIPKTTNLVYIENLPEDGNTRELA